MSAFPPVRRLQLVVAILLLALPRAGVAQDAANPELKRVIEAIHPNTLVRIETSGIHTGPFVSRSADSVVLRESDGPKQLAIVDIRTIAESQHNVKHSAIVGGVIGAVGFGALGFLSRGAVCSDGSDCKTTRLGGLFAGGLIGVLGGTVGGAAAGFVQHGWRFLYPPSP